MVVPTDFYNFMYNNETKECYDPCICLSYKSTKFYYTGARVAAAKTLETAWRLKATQIQL